MNEPLDPNIIPDNIAKARAIVQLARDLCASGAHRTLEDATLGNALWAAEDLLAEIEHGVAP